jgi:hypothetical protein
MQRASPEQLPPRAPTKRDMSTWPAKPAPRPRTRAEIEADLDAARRAAEALPQLEAKVQAAPRLSKELESWNAQNGWPERQEEAMTIARSHIEKARTAEIALKRFVGQIAESPAWRAATAMQTINSERMAARQAIAEFCRVDYEKASQAAIESGAENTMDAARGHVAEAASNTRILQMLDGLDPGFNVTREIPADQHQIVAILKMLLWPQSTLQRAPLDPSK